MISKRRIAVAIVLAVFGVTMATGASGSGCNTSPAPQHAANGGRHRQQPAPLPDTPAATRSFPASIEIVLTWTQAQSRTVVLFDFGQGKQHRTGTGGGGSWPARVQPNQYVYGLVTPAYPGEHGHLTLTIYQRSSGTVICKDDNADAGSKGSVDCGGYAKI